MAYYRFTRLQQYINGQPTDVYSKGERVDDVDYDTYDECMGGTTNTRWVSMPQTVCYNGDLWSMEKEQISYDSGSTWSDTGNTRRAAVIEPSASQCSGANNDWRVVYGEYICDGTSKCIKEAEYINNSPTGRTRAGSIVELLSGDCSVMYQWVDVPGEYVCVYKCGRADKYTKQKQQYSIDGGLHWDDTGETREGNFIEKNSADCGCDTTVTRWVTVSEEYVCVGTSKYTKEKEQTSTDGTNWTDTGNTRAGSLIEASSSSCISTRWITVDGQYSCVGYDKYNLEKEQQSTDGGEHWTDTGNTRAGSTLIEANSTDCGYVPQPITQWVTVPDEYVCDGYKKYTKEKEQISYDSGSTWTDTGNTRAGSEIEKYSVDCGYKPLYQWVADTGYVCVGYDKYNKEKQQISYDDGVTWEDTGVTRHGDTLIERNSEDCGYIEPIYQWVTVSGEYVCDGTTKYAKEKEQVSYDSGSTWSDTGNTRAGSEIETESFDCGYVAYRWVADTGYVCVGFNKMNKEKEQSSTDGINWTDTGNTRAGSNLIETLSTDCGVLYQWVTVSGEYVCVGFDKYNKEKQQYSTDNGTTWTDTGNTRAGSTLIEANSTDCGYVPQPITRWVADTGYVCTGYDKYNKEKEQTSTDGINWTDTGNTRAGSTLIEHDSEDCSYVALLTYVWPQTQSMGVKLPYKAWVENGTELYIKVTTDEDVQRQCFPGSTSDNPVWLEDSTNWYGLIFKSDIYHYGTFTFVGSQKDDIEKTITMHHTFTPKDKGGFIVVSNSDSSWPSSLPSFDGYSHSSHVTMVYGPLVKKYYDDDPIQSSLKVMFILTVFYKNGIPAPIYQWVADTGYVCVGFDKYNKEKEQVSYNPGITWEDTGNTRAGSTLIEHDSEDCASIRWVTVSGQYSCVGIDKYNLEKEQKSMDGTNWTDTGNTRTGSTLIEANSTDCGYVPHDYSTQYLTTEALGNGNISLSKVSNYNYKEPITNIQYSKNNGDWTSYTYDTNIAVAAGDKIRWKATLKDGNYSYSGSDYYSKFYSTAVYKVYGNPLSLLNNDGFIDEPGDIYEYAYCRLFENNNRLKDASGLALPATILTEWCYTGMFQGCTSLTAAPELPATTLAKDCYSSMFYKCTSLTAAPELPATTLAELCYSWMFEDCSNLNYIKCCAIDISASQCTYKWTDGVSSTGTFYKDANTTWPTGVSGIPSRWTIQNA